MSKLKTLLLSTLSLIAVVFLVACSQTKTTNLQQFEEAGSDTRVILESQGDKVIKQTLTVTILLKPLGIDADQAKDMFSGAADTYKSIEGVTYKADYKEDRVVQTIEMDFNKIDLKKLTELGGFEQETDGKYVSYEKAMKSYKEAGFKEVKDGKFQELK